MIMRNNRRVIRKALGFLLVLTLVLGMFPGSLMTAFAQEGDEDLTETITGNQLLAIDSTEPEGFAPGNTSNPYGANYDEGGTGNGTLMIPWDELAVRTDSMDEGIHKLSVYGGDKGSQKSKALSGFATVWSPSTVTESAYSSFLNSLSYTQSIGFDKTGSGRKDVAAYFGFNTQENRYYLYGLDTSRDNEIKAITDVVYWVKEGDAWKEYKPVYMNEDSWTADHYAANNLLAITAGNFGRGYETVVVAETCNARDGSGGTVTILFEYDHVSREWKRIGNPVILETVSNEDYVSTVSLAAGDLNGDDVDELIVVLGKSEDAPKGKGEAKIYVYQGVPGDTSSVLSHSRTTTSIYEDYTDGGDSNRRTISSPGVAVGDVDGDGVNEVVVGGYHFISEDGDEYDSKKAQFLAIYKRNTAGNMTKVIFTDPGMNPMITRGFYERDKIHPRAAVATVAFNGQNGKDLIFFNGQIMTYNPDAGVSVTYTPGYFDKTDVGMGNVAVSTAWVSDVAVGNFDHNNIGREQIYYVVALKELSYEAYGYKIGMIGATYEDTEDMLGTITGSGFYSTDVDKDDYQLNDADAYHTGGNWIPCQTVITALDNNTDGVRIRYRGKNYIYSDPKIEAVLQAAPYFDGVQDPGSTTYSIDTSYGESDNTTTSLDWGVGFSGEAEVSALASAKMAIELGAAFNYTWEWEKGWETSYNSVFETTNQNTVLIQRTPIIFYNYDMYDAKNGKWLENAVQVPMPLGPVWSQLSIKDYNQFVDDYDALVKSIKDSIDTSQYIYDPPVLKKIVDTQADTAENGEFLIGNEGKPEHYLNDWNNGDLTDAEKLSNMADMQLGYSGSSKTQEYAHSEYYSEGEGFSGGFSLHFSSQWGVGIAGLVDARAGFYVSADFLKGTCHYETTTRGNTVSGTVNDLDEKALENQGLSKEIIHAYQFIWSFGRWYVDLGTGGGGTIYESVENQEDIKDNVWDNSHVPVYGYKVANISMPPQPPELSVSYTDGVFTLSWEDAFKDISDGYYVYQVVNGEYVRLNAERIGKNTFAYTAAQEGLDNSAGNLFTFVATSAVDLPDESEMQSIWSNEVYFVPAISGPEGPQGKSAYQIAVENGFVGTVAEWIASLHGNGIGIEKIEKTGTSDDGLIDTYTIYYTDGNTMTFTVDNGRDGADGRGIVSYEKTSSQGNVDTYTVTYTDGTTSTFTVTNGTNGLSAYEIAVRNGFVGSEAKWIASLEGNGVGVDHIKKIGSEGLIDTYGIYYTDGMVYTFTVTNGAKGDQGEQGVQGEQGEQGVGIASIVKTSTSDDGLVDTYTITYTDETTDTFTVANGADGKDGQDGLSAYQIAVLHGFEGNEAKWIASLKGNGVGVEKTEKTGSEGLIDTYTIYYTDGSSLSFTVTNGANGNGVVSIDKTATAGNTDTYTVTMSDGTSYSYDVVNGKDGADGVGVEKIEKTETSDDGLIDTYTVTLTNGSTFTYTVNNGRDGNGVASIEKIESPQGTDPNVDTYLIKMTSGDMYTFTVRNGTDGEDGKSAYELAVENGFKGNILEWLASLKGEGVFLLGISEEAVDDLTTAYILKFSDATTYTFKVKNGEKGAPGAAGRGIVSVEKTASSSNIDTYTIAYTDGTTSKFTIYNGKDGSNGQHGVGSAGANGVDGKDGINGTDGVSIVDAKVIEGDLMITLSNGKVINAGRVMTESQKDRSPAQGNSVPWWIIYLLLGWNTLLTAGVVALAVTRKNDIIKKKAE